LDDNLDIPFFSVIMPAYNAAGYIAEAIRSVTGQEFSNWELIVVNDGSTDATISIVEPYINDKRIRLISQENKKLGAARNTGISHAKGNWICFLDADDTWLPDKLKKQHRFILNNPQADVLFSDGYTFDQSINFRLPYHFNVAKGWYTGEEMYRLEFSGNSIPVLSACIKKSYCDIVGAQYENITQGAEDWERVYKAGVIMRGSTVSAKPAFIVDGYLSGGLIGIFISLFVYGAIAQLISNKAEHLFGGYILGSALIFSGLFQIFWRGLSFEFLINSVFWSYVSMIILHRVLLRVKILKKH
jgi:glycosyltransferase involved in cell wall biosynthesis